MKTQCFILLMMSAVTLTVNAQTVSPAPAPQYTVVERGPSSRKWQRTADLTNALTGTIVETVNQYTELGDGLCYLDMNGALADSQDLIEITPTGGAAVHGQHKAWFAANLNSVGALTVKTASGEQFQSHPEGLYYVDEASGKTVRIAGIQDCVGALIPPNTVVYTNAFGGLADVVIVYAKNGVEQNVVLKQAPPAPDLVYGMDPATTRLQVRTVFDQIPLPQRQQPVLVKQENDARMPPLTDQMLFFKDVWFPVGAAFGLNASGGFAPGQASQVRVPDASDTNNIMTAKSLVLGANQAALIEAVDYQDLLPKLKMLQKAERPIAPKSAPTSSARTKSAPASTPSVYSHDSLLLASAPYHLRGVVLDYTVLSGSYASYTFSSGATYVISNSFSVGSGGGTATFQSGAVLKYATNAYMLVSGPVSFPSPGVAPVVFTSADDNIYGQMITNSTGYPNYASSHELSFYYDSYSTTVNNSKFRWAQKGVQYDASSSQCYITYYLKNSNFENSNIGAYENLPCSSLSLTSDTYCNVATPLQINTGSHSGSISLSCGVVNASQMSNCQTESTVAINPTNPSNIVMFSVTYLATGLFAASSTDAGQTWSTYTIATGGTNDIPAARGDPSCAFDKFGNLFLAYVGNSGGNCPTNIYVVVSTNGVAATNFTVLQNISSACYQLDKPWITTGPTGNSTPYSVWLAYTEVYPPCGGPIIDQNCGSSTMNYITLTGTGITNLGVTNIGSFPGGYYYSSPDTLGNAHIAVGPQGSVVAVCNSYDHFTSKYNFTKFLNSNGLQTPNWSVGLLHDLNYNNTKFTTLAAVPWSTGWQGALISPNLAWDRSQWSCCTNDSLYLVYCDAPPNSASATNCNIYVRISTNAGADWTTEVAVNDDAATTTLSHFLPSVAIDQSNGRVAIAWYDCRDDPNNKQTKCYSTISTNFGANWVPNFRLNPGPSDANLLTQVQAFDYGDYTGMDYLNGICYFTWGDNSSNFNNNPDGTGALDVYVSKVGY
jgi:hypothetical protein